MSTKRTFLVVLLAFLLVDAVLSVFTVNEREYAIKFRFGEIIRTDYEPGLHFKVPFVNNVRFFDRRILTLDNRAERFLTGEKKNVIVDFFVKWRITDVGEFYRATAGSESIALQRLLAIVKDGIRAEFARRTVVEVVSAERSELMDNMIVMANEVASDLGITIVDVRVKRIDLPQQVSGSVYERMRQERARVASQLRAEGSEDAQLIRADADRQRTVMLAEAYRDSEQIRGDGDAESARIYAEAFERNPEFYSFYRSLQAYRDSVGTDRDVLVLQPDDNDFFRYLKRSDIR